MVEKIQSVKRACELLGLSFPAYLDCFLYYNFTISQKPDYNEKLLSATSIYLSVKVNQVDNIRIRDIINAVMSDPGETLAQTATKMTLSEYIRLRDQVLVFEQFIIRLINFDLKSNGAVIAEQLIKDASALQV